MLDNFSRAFPLKKNHPLFYFRSLIMTPKVKLGRASELDCSFTFPVTKVFAKIQPGVLSHN